jgi:hypothetical protein
MKASDIVGKKVICIDVEDCKYIEKGKIYSVISFDEFDGEEGILLEGLSSCYLLSQFRLLNEETHNKNLTSICPCGIFRSECDYHRS